MTDKTKKSIPTDSLVLGREIKFTSKDFNFYDIPMYKALIIAGHDYKGEFYIILKTIYFVDMANHRLLLRRYNTAYKDFWISIDRINRIPEVELVKRPDGTEFIPKKWENSCVTHGIPIISSGFF